MKLFILLLLSSSLVLAASIVPNDSITSAKVLNGTLVSADLSATAGIVSGQIADAAITTSKILDGSVTLNKLDASSVTTAKIADTTIATIDLADLIITTAKIVDSAVTSVKILDSAVTSVKILDSAVTSVKILDGTIVSADLATTVTDILMGTTSTELALPADNIGVTWTHGHTTVPRDYRVVLRCNADEYGYVTGDEIDITSNLDGDGARFTTTFANTAVVGVFSSNWSAYFVKRRDAISGVGLTPARWRIVFRAWK